MSRKVKGSIYRKRYVLVYADTGPEKAKSMEKQLFRLFRCKRKYHEHPYLIFLTNQFQREDVVAFINRDPSFRTLTVSGTIRKCKKVMKEHISGQEKFEKVNLGNTS
jgi:hypothetical protein